MSLTFEMGSPDQPRGHALLYYRSGSSLAATYLVVLPFLVDFAKYVPPVLASQIRMTSLEQFSAFAMPPVPEAVEAYATLENMAQRRGDDLVFGGTVPENNFLESAQRVNDDVQEYASLYQKGAKTLDAPKEGPPSETASDLSVSDVMFSLMTDKDRLQELSKLVGKLRFAVEGRDSNLMAETEAEMQGIARHLPDTYHVARLIAAGRQRRPEGAKLAQLYLERCYKLADGDVEGLAKVEEEIRKTEAAA
ncbi:MAG: hypothetical protein HY681_13260 [Chloroflexi bacterium]|nr:hypothetical protein [Chloroflexota bacterium]